MRRCMTCGSEEVFLWLGGSIGSLYHCTNCHYVGPIVLETDARQPFADQFEPFWDLVEGGELLERDWDIKPNAVPDVIATCWSLQRPLSLFS